MHPLFVYLAIVYFGARRYNIIAMIVYTMFGNHKATAGDKVSV